MFKSPSIAPPAIPTQQQIIPPQLQPQGEKPTKKPTTPTFFDSSAIANQSGSATGKTLLGQ